ncbi:MAG TPA: hypothetical protein VFC78_22230 [Tepidisphaeraceae bacterium]|nr:hypothetical protein [Tepidisphaeraceae bacterium]
MPHNAAPSADGVVRAPRRVMAWPCAVLAVLLFCGSARAEHFNIDLTVTGKTDSASASADTSPPAQGRHPRPVCHAKVGEDLVLQFFFSSNFPHNVLHKVTVRFYVAPEKKAAQDAPADRENAVTQGHFVMDFKPDTGKVGLRQRLKIDKPGVYLVRVESENSDSDHEHFSAIDLVVE